MVVLFEAFPFFFFSVSFSFSGFFFFCFFHMIHVCTRRFAPRTAFSASRYPRSQGIEQNASKADREVHDFFFVQMPRGPCSTTTTRTIQACICEIHTAVERTERKSCVVFFLRLEMNANPSPITPAKLLL